MQVRFLPGAQTIKTLDIKRLEIYIEIERVGDLFSKDKRLLMKEA
jgi:hypothetical protein